MRKIFILALMVIFTASSFGQLSDRENDASTLKLGTRPDRGNMALTFGVDISNGNIADLPINNMLQSGDLLTFKYYLSQGTAIRAGIRLYKESETLKGDEGGIYAGDDPITYKLNTNSREYILVPGLEKHFNAKNIIDAFIGADLYAGFRKDQNIANYDDAATGDFQHTKGVSSSITLGLGGVVGFNVFIAQLPVSLGVEYGLNFRWNNEGKTKVTSDESIGGTDASVEYFTYDGLTFGPFADDFSKLSLSNTGMDTNQNVRLVLNIYFGK